MYEAPQKYRGSAENWKCGKQERELVKEKTESKPCVLFHSVFHSEQVCIAPECTQSC